LSKAPLISVVDDSLSVCRATGNLLESHGYATALFTSAEAFFSSEQLKDTICLISDVRMTGWSGLELQRRLIDAGHRIPTIFVTAYPDEGTRAAALRGGAAAFLPKPVREEHLISCLEGALGGPTVGDKSR
jgi:FixJ family two-component response regulator